MSDHVDSRVPSDDPTDAAETRKLIEASAGVAGALLNADNEKFPTDGAR